LKLTKTQQQVAGELLREIKNRLQFLVDVGLDYLTLARPAPTLSGGESQRIRLASQIGSGLTGVLYVLDEPTIGLHPRDNRRLLQALLKLRNLGNTLVLVEHDREVSARHHNLKSIDVASPLGTFITVTGVSGSGKSSLVHEVLYNTLARRLHRARTGGAAHDEILGLENLDKVINVDQDPIGNAPSSNPATYTGVFHLIRQLFAQLPEAHVPAYHPRRLRRHK